MNELMGQDSSFSIEQVRGQVNSIQELMRGLMQENEHYGKIPGCGTKPTLLKAGAEKIAFMFRLRSEFETTINNLENNHKEYIVKCRLIHINTGNPSGEGVGCCSTLESKFKYRTGSSEDAKIIGDVPKAYWDAKKINNIETMRSLLGGDNRGVQKINESYKIVERPQKKKIDNPDIADMYNTCLKMAKKRAYVDAILTTTAASDFFTQDIEDFQKVEIIPNKKDADNA